MKMDEFEIAQYDLVTWEPYTKLGKIGEGRNRYNKSVVAIDFTFQRQKGFFLLQVNLFLSFQSRKANFKHIFFSDLCAFNLDSLFFLGDLLAG